MELLQERGLKNVKAKKKRISKSKMAVNMWIIRVGVHNIRRNSYFYNVLIKKKYN